MRLEEFWELIGVRRADEDFAALTSDLAACDAATITAFEDRLTEALHALDTPAHAKAARARNDWFLYVRCAAVAAGRDTYELVLAHPATLRRFARREAELLLTVAPTAFERSTGRPWEHQTQLSYESGSNSQAWGGPAPCQETTPAAEHADADTWLTVGTENLYVAHLAHAIGEDPAWRAWWSASGIPRCELHLDVDVDGGTAVLVGTGLVKVHAVARGGGLPEAVADVTALLEAVRDRVGLGALPPMPQMSADLPWAPATWPPDGKPLGLLRTMAFVWRTLRNRPPA